ncbi:DNA/RNA nuclease SfsA [Zhengella mangrovi]|uniref:Sugar fermentation stimulation protein homolog n=1 Tax=Zhengella mangrovi TaxID=1982044 RepID=A0A2G1QR73_9HYPH|nr:DNA/RNA nuclease SfsA [Zhengella mangrovi]PHP67954.1 DNA/RNA nuclease SfsA [Zhengella mangrovi]
MRFPSPLIPATLIRRYKRFLADVTLDNGDVTTVSVPNTGSMMGLSDPGMRVWLSRSDNPKRKYAHTLEMVEADGAMVGINTGLPNRLVEEAILSGLLPDLAGWQTLKREQRYGANSRIDILLEDPDRGLAYVEVKNVHLMRVPGLAEFPDTVTARGTKHLGQLAAMVAEGHKAVMVYLIQRGDCSRFRLCGDLDPAYAAAFEAASAAGVEAYALGCDLTETDITATGLLAIEPARMAE